MEKTSQSTASGSATEAAPAPQTKHNDGGDLPAAAKVPSALPTRLKIRYGRTAMALIGAAALLTAVAGTVIATMGLAPVWLPIISFLTALASLVALRAMALRDRSKRSAARVDQAFRDAMNPAQASSSDGRRPSSASKPAAPVFDAVSADAAAKAQAEAAKKAEPAPVTAEELRKAALAVAAESGDSADEPVKPTWDPVAVPKPTYVEAAKAERPAPQPLDLPAEPKPEGKPSIKASATAPKVEVKTGTAAATGTADDDGSKPATGLNNLDDVLQRRRA